jgi:hypothetical protein
VCDVLRFLCLKEHAAALSSKLHSEFIAALSDLNVAMRPRGVMFSYHELSSVKVGWLLLLTDRLVCGLHSRRASAWCCCTRSHRLAAVTAACRWTRRLACLCSRLSTTSRCARCLPRSGSRSSSPTSPEPLVPRLRTQLRCHYTLERSPYPLARPRYVCECGTVTRSLSRRLGVVNAGETTSALRGAVARRRHAAG